MKLKPFALGIIPLLLWTTALAVANGNNLSGIIISEINNLPSSNEEWIEIWNNTDQELLIENLRLTENETQHRITHPNRTQIDANEIVIIANQAEIISEQLNAHEQVFDSSWSSLSLQGEALAITYNETTYEQIIYPAIEPQTDTQELLTLQRTTPTEFKLAPATPLAFNPELITTEPTPPPTETTSPRPNILISEVSPNSKNDFIELFIAPITEPIDLTNWQLIDDNRIFTFPELIITEPQFLTIAVENPNHELAHAITKTNENITLLDPDDQIIDTVCWHNESPPTIELTTLQTLVDNQHWFGDCLDSNQITSNSSIGRRSQFDTNSKQDWTYFPHPTPNTINHQTNQSPQAKITIQSGKLINSETISINLTGKNSIDLDNDDLNYQWYLNNEDWTTNPNPAQLTISDIGQHQIKLIVSDSLQATSSTTITLIVTEPIPPPLPEPTCPIPEKVEPQKCPISTPLPATTVDLDQTGWKDIKIHSFLPNPTGTDTSNEWIKLINTGSTTITLTNWQIDDSENGSKPYTIPIQSISPNQILSLSNANTKINLNNTGDTVRLFSPDGKIIDQFTYEKVSEAETISPLNPTQNQKNNIQASLQPSQTPKPKTKTTAKKKTTTPKYKNGDESNKILITEIFPNPPGPDTNQEWIEISNNSNKSINLGNWKLKNNTKEYPISDKTNIPANSKIKFNPANIKLILGNTTANIQLSDFKKQVIDQVSYNKSKEGQSYSLIQDHRNKLVASITPPIPETWRWTPHTTPATNNPELLTITGTTKINDLTNNQLTIVNADQDQYKINFNSKQIPNQQLQLIQAASQNIKLETLKVTNQYFLEQIIELTPLTTTKKHNYYKYLPSLILLLIIGAIVAHPKSRKWLTQKSREILGKPQPI